MNKKEKILYRYFLQAPKKIFKIPKKDEHKERLTDCVRTVFPTFMHPYAFGMMSNEETKVAESLIDTFENHKVKKRLIDRIRGFFGV